MASPTGLTLSVLRELYAIVPLPPETALPQWALAGELWSLTRTADELSIVCAESQIPDGTGAEKGWRCFKVHGPLDLSMTGVMLQLSRPLAEAGVALFAISTFDTDYFLVRATQCATATRALRAAGHEVV